MLDPSSWQPHRDSVPSGLRRVLFLSANMGTGHSAAAENILKALRLHHPEVEGLVVNSFQHAHAGLGRFVERSYLQVLKHVPQLYGRYYLPPERPGALSGLRRWANDAFAGPFMALVDRWQPDAIVCTHAFPSGICTVLKEKYALRTPVVGVITDFVVHPFWIHPSLDMYTVATPDLAAQLQERGVSSNRVAVTGIPIDPAFAEPGDRTALRDKLGLRPSHPVVLVMGGGFGMQPVAEVLEALKGVNQALEMVVLTGTNHRLQRKFEVAARQVQGRVRLHVYGYVNNVHEFMQASDLLVTKPGGLTTAEALAAGLPMLLVKPIPGQEARNARFLLAHQVALDGDEGAPLSAAIEGALGAELALQRMKQQARALGAPRSAVQIASVLEGMVTAPVGVPRLRTVNPVDVRVVPTPL